MGDIRPTEQRDIPDLMRLLEQVNMVHHTGRPDLFKGPTTKYSEAELAEILSDSARPVFVLEAEGRVRGYVFCQLEEQLGDRLMEDCRTLYIDDLCVDREARRQGIGRRLYQHALRQARDMGCQRVTLNVWTLNPDAMRFYEQCGLTPYKVGMEQMI